MNFRMTYLSERHVTAKQTKRSVYIHIEIVTLSKFTLKNKEGGGGERREEKDEVQLRGHAPRSNLENVLWILNWVRFFVKRIQLSCILFCNFFPRCCTASCCRQMENGAGKKRKNSNIKVSKAFMFGVTLFICLRWDNARS